jgi:hypothetical protein
MTSLQTGVRQISNNSGYFITVNNLINQVVVSPKGPVALWASSFGSGDFSTNGCYASSISSAGALLRDMGKSIVSSGAFFRKVQLVVPQGTGGARLGTAGTTSTFGVAGAANVTGQLDFLTGYIKLGFEGQETPAPVANFGR